MASKCQLADFFHKKTVAKRASIIPSQWQRRYFVLKDGYLIWYEYRDEGTVPAGFNHKCNGMLSLIDCTLVTEGITSKSKLRAEELSKHRCKVTAGEVTMDLRFDSDAQMQRWVHAIEKAREFSFEAKEKLEAALKDAEVEARETAEAHSAEKASLAEAAARERAELEEGKEAEKAAIAAEAAEEKERLAAEAAEERTRLLAEKEQAEAAANERLSALTLEIKTKADGLSAAEAAKLEAERRAAEAEAKRRKIERQLRAAEGSLKAMERVLREHNIDFGLDLDISVGAIKELFEAVAESNEFDANKASYMKEALSAAPTYRKDYASGK